MYTPNTDGLKLKNYLTGYSLPGAKHSTSASATSKSSNSPTGMSGTVTVNDLACE